MTVRHITTQLDVMQSGDSKIWLILINETQIDPVSSGIECVIKVVLHGGSQTSFFHSICHYYSLYDIFKYWTAI